MSRVQSVIVACAVLHNIAIDMRDELFQDNIPPDVDDNEQIATPLNMQDTNVRNRLINNYFVSLLR